MRTKLLIMFVLVVIAVTAIASAEEVFYESFEDPDITGTWIIKGFGQDGPWPGWIGEGQKYVGIKDKDINVPGSEEFINSFGDQVAYIFNNIPSSDTGARLTTTADSLNLPLEANTTYTLKLNTASQLSYEIEYHVQLLAISGGGAETILSEARAEIASNDLAANRISLVYRTDGSPANLGERIAIRLRKGTGPYQYNVFYDNISLTVDKMNPSPYDGQIVPSGIVDLSWTNLDPNVGDTVYVDILFGTEPNSALPGYDMTAILDGAANTTTTQVNTVPGESYYWQIISYINGDDVTDPNQSDVYSFYTASDLAPELVDIITPDMVTWSDEPVSLTSNVVDDGASSLTYTWTSVPADGIAFTPSTNDPNLTVTITKPVGLSFLPITNYGFEDPRDADDGNGFIPYPDGDRDYTGHLRAYTWTFPNWGYYFNGYCGVLNPTTSAYPDEAPEGGNVGFVESAYSSNDPYYDAPGGLSINTIADLKPNTNYTLSVKVGNPLYNDAFPGYRVQLLADNAVLAQDANSLPIAPGTFVTVEVQYASGSTVTAGQKLGIRLFSLDNVYRDIDAGDTSVYEVHFDDVKLLTDGDSTYTITLEVKDENNPAMEDSMQIDVFDTPCQATIIGMGIKGQGDANADCSVDIADLLELTAIWLNDNSLIDATITPGGDNGIPSDPNSPTAGPDMLTWSGQPVLLDATIVNDPNTPQWSADSASLADTNLNISIDNPNSEDTSVLISKVAPTGDATKITMTLSISGNEDSMVIDVYDDECAAAVGIDPLAIEDVDFNIDCKTNMGDMVLMAEKWLTTSTISEPGIKP